MKSMHISSDDYKEEDMGYDRDSRAVRGEVETVFELDSATRLNDSS